jgi:hypothetical protein
VAGIPIRSQRSLSLAQKLAIENGSHGLGLRIAKTGQVGICRSATLLTPASPGSLLQNSRYGFHNKPPGSMLQQIVCCGSGWAAIPSVS